MLHDLVIEAYCPMKHTETDLDKQSGEENVAEETLATVDIGTVTPEQFAELKDRAAKADEHYERLLRSSADFDNYKKRATREKQDAIKFANESLLGKLIPVLDNFDMALSATQNTQGDAVKSLQTGVNMIYQQLKNALVEAGLEEINAEGATFDPNFHEAVSQKETAEVPEGQVVQQLRKGYKFKERLLRPATVVVAKHPAS
jgi:molecular chaperone GrpE